MEMDPREVARKKFEQAIQGKKERDEKADAIIWVAVLINSGLGVVPLGINVWTFVGVASVMVVWLGGVYDCHVTNDGAAKIIRQLFTSAGLMFVMFTFGMKFFAEVLKGAGVITMGGTTLAGMALDAVLSGAVTYALGFTAKEYFKRNQKMTQSEMHDMFHAKFAEGKRKVSEAKQSN